MEIIPKPHLAILASPGMGHVIPCLELAKCLVSHHHVQVSFFVLSSTQSSTLQTQLLQQPDGLNIINLPPVDTSSAAFANLDLLFQISRIIEESLPFVRSTIVKMHQPPTVLIVDVFGTDAFDIADDLKMEKYLYYTSNATVLAFSAFLPTLVEEIEGDLTELTDPLRVPGCKPVSVEELGLSLLDRNSGNFKCLLRHARRYAEASGVLINTFEDLEPQTIRSLSDSKIQRQIPLPPVHPVGPMTKPPALPSMDKADCLTWLDNQPSDSVLFVSFGSGGGLSTQQITELSWGLELSHKRFLWVVRPPHDQVASAAYLNAGGGVNNPSEYLPSGFLTRTRRVGLVVPDWAPQVEILSHGSIGGFLSHCGWNSTLESIVHGVPMITWPLYAEQSWNALLLAEDIGVAVRPRALPEKGVVRRDEIEKMVRLVMEGDEGKVMKVRAKELKNRACRAVGKGGSSYNSLSLLVEKWKNRV